LGAYRIPTEAGLLIPSRKLNYSSVESQIIAYMKEDAAADVHVVAGLLQWERRVCPHVPGDHDIVSQTATWPWLSESSTLRMLFPIWSKSSISHRRLGKELCDDFIGGAKECRSQSFEILKLVRSQGF
jgi:hypothetical protein